MGIDVDMINESEEEKEQTKAIEKIRKSNNKTKTIKKKWGRLLVDYAELRD